MNSIMEIYPFDEHNLVKLCTITTTNTGDHRTLIENESFDVVGPDNKLRGRTVTETLDDVTTQTAYFDHNGRILSSYCSEKKDGVEISETSEYVFNDDGTRDIYRTTSKSYIDKDGARVTEDFNESNECDRRVVTREAFDGTTIEIGTTTAVDDVDWVDVETHDHDGRVLSKTIQDSNNCQVFIVHRYTTINGVLHHISTHDSYDEGELYDRYTEETYGSEVPGKTNRIIKTFNTGMNAWTTEKTTFTNFGKGYIEELSYSGTLDDATNVAYHEERKYDSLHIRIYRLHSFDAKTMEPEPPMYMMHITYTKNIDGYNVTFSKQETINDLPKITQELIDGCRKTVESPENVSGVYSETDEVNANHCPVNTKTTWVKKNTIPVSNGKLFSIQEKKYV